jgi:hypothetical protein
MTVNNYGKTGRDRHVINLKADEGGSKKEPDKSML